MTMSDRPPSEPASDRLAGLFPDPSASDTPWWRRRSRLAVASVIVVAVLLSTGVVAGALGSASADYRTATVATHDVDALVTGVATFEPVSQATVAFPASGMVSAVDVALGDSVVAGQTLASLDAASLVESLHEAEATLAQAELTLEQALSGEAISGAGGTGGVGNMSTRTTSTGAGSSPAIVLTAATATGRDPQLAAAQQGVLDSQQQVDAALAVADAALDAATAVCAAAGVDTSGIPPTTTPTAATLTACQTATREVLTAQVALSDAQRALVAASNTLDTLLTQRAAASATDSSEPTTGASDDTSAPAASGPTGSTGSSPSSADLIAYQKAVDAAVAEVTVAEQAIAQADIASPIAGTVVGVELTVGESVTSGSTTQHIIVVGSGGYEAVTTVGVDEVTDVEVGQRATLVPDGTSQSLDATVVAISAAPDASASTTSYRVVLGLSDADSTQAAADALHNGSTGSVAIVTERATSALAVPTSAVTASGDRHTVTVLDGSTTEVVTVDVGVVGATWTEITDGVRAGQDVVLADLDEPLPGSATASSSSSNFEIPGGGGAFTGGGPPAGFAPPGG